MINSIPVVVVFPRMCSTSIILVFLITEYLIISSIIGISVASGQDESISDGHSGDSPPTLDLALSGTSVAFEKDGAEDIDYSGEQSGETATIELDGEDGMTSQGDSTSTSTSEAAVPGCLNGTFGENCAQTCPCNMINTDICYNVTGNCQCKPSWKGITCEEDVDECNPPTPFLNPCVIKQNTVCANTIGSYECKCIAGYREEDDTGCVVTTPPNTTSTKDYSMIWYIGGGLGGAIVLNVGIVCAVFFVRRRNRAYDSFRCQDDRRGLGKHQFKNFLSVTEGQVKEDQENSADNSPKNLNDPCGVEIHKLESFLPVSAVQPKEDKENSANDGSKTLNDISGGEIHELESVLPVAEVQPKEDQKNSAYDDSMNLNDICDMQLHLFESFLPKREVQAMEGQKYRANNGSNLKDICSIEIPKGDFPLPEAEVQAKEGQATSANDVPKLESFLPVAEDQTKVGQENCANDGPRILNDCVFETYLIE